MHNYERRPCSEPGCGRPTVQRSGGRCGMHRLRLDRNGSTRARAIRLRDLKPHLARTQRGLWLFRDTKAVAVALDRATTLLAFTPTEGAPWSRYLEDRMRAARHNNKPPEPRTVVERVLQFYTLEAERPYLMPTPDSTAILLARVILRLGWRSRMAQPTKAELLGIGRYLVERFALFAHAFLRELTRVEREEQRRRERDNQALRDFTIPTQTEPHDEP
jgi:hypothetical protein